MGPYDWMKVVDVMTKHPLVMTPSETIGEADQVMTENRIRQLPVVEGSSLLGISPTGTSALFLLIHRCWIPTGAKRRWGRKSEKS